ncbi:YifB family Mg chelatase-like AAA ATPase [Actinomycetota bacterium]
MTLGRTRGIALTGIDGALVEVEAFMADGLPAFHVSGLPDAACAQSPQRIKAACAVGGYPVPLKRITVNLSPASLPKTGSGFDLPIAVALLQTMDRIKAPAAHRVVHIGEVGLDGAIRAVRGILPAVLAAREAGATDVWVPEANAAEAALVDGVRIHCAPKLSDLLTRYELAGSGDLPDHPLPTVEAGEDEGRPRPDLAEVVGQPEARFALELAAAGGHHLFFMGPPGAGKTMLAERLVTLLPELSLAQSLDVLAIRSVAGRMESTPTLGGLPPFVAPHHSASTAAMVGGGSGQVRPGAISEAHHGVLFLDEVPEFKSSVLQALRQPLESGQVVVARATQSVRFPARFQLVMAANPCPCGQGSGKGLACTCTPMRRRAYVGRISGPLLDRVDLQVAVQAVTRASLAADRGEDSATVASRVAVARSVQAERWAAVPGVALNAQVSGALLRRRPWRLSPGVTGLIDRALDRGALTLRGYDRVIRVAWTCADLRGTPTPTADDIGTALSLRQQLQASA